jgi:hypothetical protein
VILVAPPFAADGAYTVFATASNYFRALAFDLPERENEEIAMGKTRILAVVCFGAFLMTGAAGAAPISTGGALNSDASRAAIGTSLPDATVQDVRWNGRWHRRHWGWHPYRHYGWRNRWHRHYAWRPHHRRFY